MVKISKKMRERLLKQQQDMATGGMLIPNKGFSKRRLRMLPVGEDELPGTNVISYYCASLQGDKKATTSPATFGFPCPIQDFFATTVKKMTKEERDEAYDTVNTNSEYWILVLDRGDEGDAENPKLRILAGKKTVYQRIQQLMLDDDLGEDITDPLEGRDLLVKKTGQGKSGTEWTCEKLDQTALHDDDDMYNAIVDAANGFVMEDHFFAIDWDVLAQIYEALTGKAIPKKYLKNKGKTPVKAAAEEEDEAEAEDEVEVEYEEEAEEEVDGEEEAEGDEGEDEADFFEGDAVTFNDEGEEYEGTFVGMSEEEEDVAVVDVDGEEWEIQLDNLTKVEEEAEDEDEGEEGEDEDEAEAEEEDEDEAEEEEPPAVSRRRTARKPATKKTSAKRPAAKKKTAKKPIAKKTTKKKVGKKKTGKKPVAKKTTTKKTGKKKTASKAIRSRMRRPRGGK